jgi:UDP-N-acetylglucosamine 2-epimerase (non-hydrolysing)
MKLLSIVAARPNFMKIAPIIRAIDKHNAAVPQSPITSHQSPAPNHSSPIANHHPPVTIDHILVHTGQHYDYEMSQVFFQDLKLPQPDYHLGVGSGTHAEQTGKTMIEVEKVLLAEKPDMVVVVGDVNATLAAALAAVKLHIPVSHVEAGVRSGDMGMPEEVNRLLTDHISDYLFTTSKYDDESLKKEGVPEHRIFRVGNVMADSLLYCRELAAKSDILGRLGLKKDGYVLATLHRPSNVDDKESLSRIIGALMEISEKVPVVFPAHPRTRKNMEDFGLLPQSPVPNHQSPITSHRLLITPPLGYLDFLNLETNATMVVTDSGGVQVETTVLGVRCLTLLDSPVWPITHDTGLNILVGTDSHKLVHEALHILTPSHQSLITNHQSPAPPPLWDGQSADRIASILVGRRPS